LSNFNLLIIDLDGTLIGKDETISARVSAALAQLPRELVLSLATGRPPVDVISFARQLGWSSPQICDGGATILDPVSGQPLWRSAPLAREHTRRILARLDHLDLAFIATHPGGVVTDRTRCRSLDLSRISAMDLEDRVADELAAYCADPDLEIAKMFLPTSGLWGVNFAPSGVNKGTAATRLANILGTGPAQMIAAGDSYNDLSLFEVCGLRIAMGNSPRELQAMANFVAPPIEEDGLAVAIEEYLTPLL
jgi:hypothetical protein